VDKQRRVQQVCKWATYAYEWGWNVERRQSRSSCTRPDSPDCQVASSALTRGRPLPQSWNLWSSSQIPHDISPIIHTEHQHADNKFSHNDVSASITTSAMMMMMMMMMITMTTRQTLPGSESLCSVQGVPTPEFQQQLLPLSLDNVYQTTQLAASASSTSALYSVYRLDLKQ